MEKIRIAIAGLGSRGESCYGQALLEMKDRTEVVALAEPREERLKAAAADHGVPAEMCFETAEEMLAQSKLADALLLCTQDRQHVPQAIEALKKGYDILME